MAQCQRNGLAAAATQHDVTVRDVMLIRLRHLVSTQSIEGPLPKRSSSLIHTMLMVVVILIVDVIVTEMSAHCN